MDTKQSNKCSWFLWCELVGLLIIVDHEEAGIKWMLNNSWNAQDTADCFDIPAARCIDQSIHTFMQFHDLFITFLNSKQPLRVFGETNPEYSFRSMRLALQKSCIDVGCEMSELQHLPD